MKLLLMIGAAVLILASLWLIYSVSRKKKSPGSHSHPENKRRKRRKPINKLDGLDGFDVELEGYISTISEKG